MSESPQTRMSVIFSMKAGDPKGWTIFDGIYRSFVSYWARKYWAKYWAISNEIDDIVQDVFLHVTKKIGEFERQDKDGAFRCWIKEITFRKTMELGRSHSRAKGGTDAGLTKKFPFGRFR